jgi:plasmid replication initiation protein
VKPHQAYGMATIWDADILIWAASQLSSMKNKGVNDLPRTLHTRTYDLLKAIGRGTGGDHAKLLVVGIARLKSMMIETNIGRKDGEEMAIFSWIDAGGGTAYWSVTTMPGSRSRCRTGSIAACWTTAPC